MKIDNARQEDIYPWSGVGYILCGIIPFQFVMIL